MGRLPREVLLPDSIEGVSLVPNCRGVGPSAVTSIPGREVLLQCFEQHITEGVLWPASA